LLKKSIKREPMKKYYSEIKRLPKLTEPGTKTALIPKRDTTANITRGIDRAGAMMTRRAGMTKMSCFL